MSVMVPVHRKRSGNMTTNLGSADRALRLFLGVGLLSLLLFVQSGVRWLGLAGLVLLLTSLINWCPLYSLLRIRTRPKP